MTPSDNIFGSGLLAEVETLAGELERHQQLIQSGFALMNYDETLRLCADLSHLIFRAEKCQIEEEIRCSKFIAAQMEEPKTSFAKADVLMKCSSAYRSYRYALNVRQAASRGLVLARLQAQRLSANGLPPTAADKGEWDSDAALTG